MTYSYNDAPPTPSVTATKLATPDPSIVSKTIMDGVGHVTETLVTSVTPNIRTDTAYDGQGRAYTASNPYYVGSPSPSDGTTTYTYDALGRATNVKHPDNNNTTTSYSGNCATVTDPQSKARKTCADGLGRLTSVLEDPGSSPHLNYTTTYAYDALDNLKTVTQGSQTRTFGYDSLSRLTSARNPEWTPTGGSSPCSVTYSYDANGNVASRVAPQPNQLSCSTTVTTNYTYDLLNRLTLKAYTNDPANTLTAYFGYDVDHSTMGTLRIPISYGVGRLSWTYTNASMTTNSYDRMGRVQEYWQCTPYNCSGSNPWHAHYDFDLGGGVKDGTHPAGFTLTNSINGAQQVTQISYSPSDSTHPANLIPTVAYTPFGAVSKLQNGCAGTSCVQLQETYDYN